MSASQAADAAEDVQAGADEESLSVHFNFLVVCNGVLELLKHLSKEGVVTGLHHANDKEEVNSDTGGDTTEVAAAFAERLATSQAHFYYSLLLL